MIKWRGSDCQLLSLKTVLFYLHNYYDRLIKALRFFLLVGEKLTNQAGRSMKTLNSPLMSHPLRPIRTANLSALNVQRELFSCSFLAVIFKWSLLLFLEKYFFLQLLIQ